MILNRQIKNKNTGTVHYGRYDKETGVITGEYTYCGKPIQKQYEVTEEKISCRVCITKKTGKSAYRYRGRY